MEFGQEVALLAKGITGIEDNTVLGGAHLQTWVGVGKEIPRRGRG